MKAIKHRKGILSKDGNKYTFPQPSFGQIQALHEEFVKCMAESLKPVGMGLSQHGMPEVEWVGEVDKFDLTKLKKITFTATLVRTK